MKKSRFVTSVNEDGKLETHGSPADGNYSTLCGADLDDTCATGLSLAKPEDQSDKINCTQCIQIINAVRKYSKKDFANQSLWGK